MSETNVQPFMTDEQTLTGETASQRSEEIRQFLHNKMLSCLGGTDWPPDYHIWPSRVIFDHRSEGAAMSVVNCDISEVGSLNLGTARRLNELRDSQDGPTLETVATTELLSIYPETHAGDVLSYGQISFFGKSKNSLRALRLQRRKKSVHITPCITTTWSDGSDSLTIGSGVLGQGNFTNENHVLLRTVNEWCPRESGPSGPRYEWRELEGQMYASLEGHLVASRRRLAKRSITADWVVPNSSGGWDVDTS